MEGGATRLSLRTHGQLSRDCLLVNWLHVWHVWLKMQIYGWLGSCRHICPLARTCCLLMARYARKYCLTWSKDLKHLECTLVSAKSSTGEHRRSDGCVGSAAARGYALKLRPSRVASSR